MREYYHKSYYDSDLMNKKYIDTHLAVQTTLETFFSDVLFKGDLSRVVYASPDMAFRRRVQTLDSKKEYNEDAPIVPEGLDLPFIQYFPESDPEADDRPSAVSASSVIRGEWDEDFETHVRSLATKQTYKATLFVARRDEARFFHTMLLQEKEPKFPIRYYYTLEWRGVNLTIPINITIENLSTTPNFEQTKFLTKNKVFPVTVDFTVRTYQLIINSFDNFCQLPKRFSNVIDDYDELNAPTEYITEKVVLNWASEKFNMDMDSDKIDYESDEIKNLLRSPYYFNQKELSEAELLSSVADVPTTYTTDVIQGYFQTDSSAELNRIAYNKAKSTPTTAYFDFAVKPACFDKFLDMEISIPGYEPVVVKDCKARNAVITGLTQNSEYKVTALVHATDSTVKTYFLTIVTPIDTERVDETPTPENINVLKTNDEAKDTVASAPITPSEQPNKPNSKRAGLVGMRLI